MPPVSGHSRFCSAPSPVARERDGVRAFIFATLALCAMPSPSPSAPEPEATRFSPRAAAEATQPMNAEI